MFEKRMLRKLQARPGRTVTVNDFGTSWVNGFTPKKTDAEALRHIGEQELARSLEELAKAQDLLYADNRYSVLIVLQAMDAAGKDGTIQHVMSGVNPQGCQVFSFKQPSTEELDHTFLWRCMKNLPERGRIGIFNRSYYEEVLVVKVHEEWLGRQRLPTTKYNTKFWRRRYDDINAFERHLVRNGTIILKIFLNVSKAEQKQRFLARLDDPTKLWKFSAGDVAERAHWDEYMAAYGEAFSATSTKWAPWHIIPADHKWYARALVGNLIATSIRGLDLRYPEIGAAERRSLAAARRQLTRERPGG